MKLKYIIESDKFNEGLLTSISPWQFESFISISGNGWNSSPIVQQINVANDSGYVLVDVDDEDNPISYEIFKKSFTILSRKAETVGWFPASIIATGYINNKWNEDERIKANEIEKLSKYEKLIIQIQFEAKYDEEMSYEDLPDFIYHLTDKKFIDKIKKIGLSPKSKNKHSNHPARIYFVDDEEALLELLPNGMSSYIDKAVFLKIDTNKLPKTFKFYPDPQYVDGFYTYDNIPPYAIEFDIKF